METQQYFSVNLHYYWGPDSINMYIPIYINTRGLYNKHLIPRIVVTLSLKCYHSCNNKIVTVWIIVSYNHFHKCNAFNIEGRNIYISLVFVEINEMYVGTYIFYLCTKNFETKKCIVYFVHFYRKFSWMSTFLSGLRTWFSRHCLQLENAQGVVREVKITISLV